MTDRERGTLDSVDEVPEGSSLLVDAAAAALLVPLVNDGDFRDEGGLAWIDGASYAYTGISDAKELQLDVSNPLAGAVAAGEPVLALTNLGYPEARWVALVRVDPNDEEPVSAYIDTTDRAYFRLGDVDAGALVEVESLGTNRYRIASRLYDPASFDGTHLDPGSIPDPVPVDPPTVSPAVTLSGYAGGIFARVPTLPASQEIEWHVWDATTGDETYVPTQADPVTLFETSRSAVQPIERLPNGTLLVEGTTYYVATWAKNDAGYAPAPSAVASGQMDMSVVRDLVAVSIAAGGIVTGQIDVGASSWSADEGLVFRDQNGIPYIILPADGVSAAQIRAFIIAAGITVEDNANFYGLTQMFGTMKLASGITDPAIPAQMSRTWNSISTELSDYIDAGFGAVWSGLAERISNTAFWVTMISFAGSGAVRAVNKTTGVFGTLLVNLPDFQPDGGVVVVAGDYYVLGKDFASGRGGDWYIRKYNSSFIYQAESLFTTWSNVNHRPMIGTDGTNLLIVRCTNAGNLRLIERTTAFATVQTVDLIAGGQAYDIGGVFRGVADFGATRLIVSFSGSVPNHVAWDTSHARVPTHDFPAAEGKQIRGLQWDGTRFRSLNQAGKIWDYATGHPSASTVYGGYAWVDEDTSSGSVRHETKVSPGKSFAWPARSEVVVTGQPAPDALVTDPTKRDKANLLRIYLGGSASTMRLQDGGGTNSALPLGVTSLSIENPDTGSVIGLTTSSFIGVDGAVGVVQSAQLATDAAPVSQLKGDGSGRLLKFFQSGERTTGTLVANTPASQAVTFLHPFDVAPQVVGFTHLDPDNLDVWATLVTPTGFTLNYRRITGTASFTARWIAIATT